MMAGMVGRACVGEAIYNIYGAPGRARSRRLINMISRADHADNLDLGLSVNAAVV